MAGADRERQNGKNKDRPSQYSQSSARSRSPSPNRVSLSSKMPKYKLSNRKHGSFISTTGSTGCFLSTTGSEDSGICSAVTSPGTPSHAENDVFSPVATQGCTEGLSRIANGTSEVPDTDAKIVKKRLSGLFKAGKHAAFKRQDSDLAYRIQNSHVTSVNGQNGLHSDVTNGSSSHSLMHRDLSIEEELQIRIEQLSGVTRQWKTRWRNEKELNQQLQEHFVMCEKECYETLDNLQDSYEWKISELEEKVRKVHEVNTQLIQAKTQAETELKEVINNANKESTKFKEELEDVHKEVVKLSESVNNIKESNAKLQAENKGMKMENEKLKADLKSAQMSIENKKNGVVHSVNIGERGNGLSIQSKAAEMETELYKTLLDIALNKIKFLEECASSKTSNKLHLPSANRGRFVLRVSDSDPTDMFMENIAQSMHNVLSKEHDGQSLSSVSTADDVSIDKRASITSSVNISDLFGSQGSLNGSQGLQQSASSTDSIVREPENGKNCKTFDSNSLSRIRSISMNGDDNHEGSEHRASLRDISGKREANDNSSKRISLPIDLIDGSDNFLIDSRSRSPCSQDRDSISSEISSTLSTHSHALSTNSQTLSTNSLEDKIKHPKDKSKDRSHPKQTVKDVKRKKSETKSTSTHMLTLQKLQKYRSVGEIFKGIRKTSKEAPVYGSHEHLHNENIEDSRNKGRRMTQPVMRSNTMDGDVKKPKLKQYRRASSNQEFPLEPEKRHSVSNDASSTGKDEEVKSESLHSTPSASSDNVSNTRTSGFVALRQRRNGFVMDSNDFKDISKHLKKKSKSSNDFSSILRRFSRDNLLNKDDDNDERDGEDEPQAVKPRRRSRLSSKS